MAQIKNKGTKIEIKVRKHLFSRGFRYRINVKSLPGKPDIVLKKYNTVIFIHGCFWHRHDGCRDATTPKTRTEFWEQKFNANVDNDIKHMQKLQDKNWNVIVIWECEIERHFEKTMERVISELERTSTANVSNSKI